MENIERTEIPMTDIANVIDNVMEKSAWGNEINNKFNGINNKFNELDRNQEEINNKIIDVDNIHGLFGHTATGTSLPLSPTSDFPVSKLKLYGKSEQVQTTGANLLNIHDFSAHANSTVKIDNDTITVTKNTTNTTFGAKCTVNNLMAGKTYILSFEEINFSEVYIYSDQVFGTLITKGENNIMFTAPDTNSVVIGLYMVPEQSGVTMYAKKPMLNAGTTPLPYEPYSGGVPSPSPDWAQPIDVPGMVCRGRQLINISEINPTGNADWDIGYDYVKCNSTKIYDIKSTKQFTLQPGTYTLSAKHINASNAFVTIRNRDSNLDNILSINNANLSRTISISEKTNVDVAFYSSVADNPFTITEPMLNAGYVPLPYEPFSSGINQLNITAESQTIQGVTFTVNEDKSITANGTNTGNRSALLTLMSMPINIIEQSTVVIQAQSGLQIYFSVDGKDVYSIEGGGIYTIEAGHILNLAYAYVKINTTVSNITARIMLVKSEYANYPYSPYVENGGNIRKFNTIGVEAVSSNLLDINNFVSYVNSNVRIENDTITATRTVSRDDFVAMYTANNLVSGENYIISFSETNFLSTFIYSDKIYGNRIANGENNVVFTAPDTGKVIIGLYISIEQSGVPVSAKKPMINRGTEPLPYEPYRTPSTSILRTPNGLPGIKVPNGYTDYTYIDEDGQKWVSDTIEYEGDVPKYVKRIGKFNADGSITVNNTWDTGYGNLYGFALYDGTSNPDAPSISDRLVRDTALFGKDSSGFYTHKGNPWLIRIKISSDKIGDQDISTYLKKNPTHIYYILETPVTTDMDADTYESIRQFHTLDGATTVSNTGDCNMDIEYTVDTRTEVEKRVYVRDDETGDRYRIGVDSGMMYIEY